MKVRIEKKALVAIANAAKSIAERDVSSIFARMRLDAVGGYLASAGSDGSLQVEAREECDVAETGVAYVNAAKFAAFAAAMPEGAVEIAGEGCLELSAGGVRFRIAAYEDADWPQMAGPGEADPAFELPPDVLCEMFRKVGYAASTDETRAILCGVNAHVGDGRFGLVATDGRRLAHIDCDIPSGAPEGPLETTFSSRAAAVLRDLLAKTSNRALCSFAEGSFRITADGWSVTGRSLGGAYPAWRAVVPQNQPHSAVVSRADLLAAVRRVKLCADAECAVDLVLADGRCEVECAGSVFGASAVLPQCVIDDGAKMRCHVNAHFVEDVLASVECDAVSIGFGDSTGPLKFTAEALPWVAVVMTMR